MRSDGEKPQEGMPKAGRSSNGFIPNSFRAFSRIVSSGASTVASSVKSAAVSVASAIVDRDADFCHEQVLWAGFDNLERVGDMSRRVLLMGFQYGFQIWDVEEADNVHSLVCKRDGPVSFMQMLPEPQVSKQSVNKFEQSRPLLAICADVSFSGRSNVQDELSTSHNGSVLTHQGLLNKSFAPTMVWFYSLTSRSYVHTLNFRSIVYLVRCSSRVVAVLQAAQIHCFDASTLEREYNILTNPIVASASGFGGIGFGPLAIGSRWMAYSGTPVATSDSGRVCPQQLTPSASFPCPASNGRLVAQFVKESSRQLATRIVTLGDVGSKKLSRYYSVLLQDGNNTAQFGTPGCKVQGASNAYLPDIDNIGMVIIRDISSKSVVTQFKAHKSPISSLCFDPSGMLLVTASVQGHNINVFRIMPGFSGSSTRSDTGATYLHLYRLQRGITDAVIQDISFSQDSHWIIVSSSRGTSHLFAISPFGGPINFQSADAFSNDKNYTYGVIAKDAILQEPKSGSQMTSYGSIFASGPLTLSVVSRIRSGNNGWKSTVGGAAAAATGRMNLFPMPIASAFHKHKGSDTYSGFSPWNEKYHLLVFSPFGCVIQYALCVSSGLDSVSAGSGLITGFESSPVCDARVLVEAIQKWNICQRQHRRDREDNVDVYFENGNSDSNKVFPEGVLSESSSCINTRHTLAKVKICYEEKHHMYISEAELHVHQTYVPLWSKHEIHFLPMVIDAANIHEKGILGGEREVEIIPCRVIEARSEDLIPIYDHHHSPRFQQIGISTLGNGNGLLHQRSGLSENGSTYRTSLNLSDSASNGDVAVAELQNYSGQRPIACNVFPIPSETSLSFVNSNDCPSLNTTHNCK